MKHLDEVYSSWQLGSHQNRINPDNFHKLHPVFPRLLHYLSILMPTKYALLSQDHYRRIVPKMYKSVLFNNTFIKAMFTSQYNQRMISACENTIFLSVDSFNEELLFGGRDSFVALPGGVFRNVRSIEISNSAVISRSFSSTSDNWSRITDAFAFLLGLGARPLPQLLFHVYPAADEAVGDLYLESLNELSLGWQPETITFIHRSNMYCYIPPFRHAFLVFSEALSVIQYAEVQPLCGHEMEFEEGLFGSVLQSWKDTGEALNRLPSPSSTPTTVLNPTPQEARKLIRIEFYLHKPSSAKHRFLKEVDKRNTYPNETRTMIRDILRTRSSYHFIEDLDLNWDSLRFWKPWDGKEYEW